MGGNASAAELSGISPLQTIVWAHALSGLLAAIAGVMVVARLQIGPAVDRRRLADPVVRGTGDRRCGPDRRPRQRRRHFLGVVIVAIITQSLVLFQIDPFVVQIVLGSLILLAVGMNRLREVRVERASGRI